LTALLEKQKLDSEKQQYKSFFDGSGCSQSAIGWITGHPMEELEKLPKELKGSATL
jgi:hypothetical protein